MGARRPARSARVVGFTSLSAARVCDELSTAHASVTTPPRVPLIDGCGTHAGMTTEADKQIAGCISADPSSNSMRAAPIATEPKVTDGASHGCGVGSHGGMQRFGSDGSIAHSGVVAPYR